MPGVASRSAPEARASAPSTLTCAVRAHALAGTRPPIRVMVVDAQPLLRLGVATIIDRQTDMQLVAQADDGQSAVELCLLHRPDVTLMEIPMPVMNGIDAMRAIRKAWPKARILVFTSSRGDLQARRSLQAGAAGYLFKSVQQCDLVNTIRRVHNGQKAIPVELALDLVGRIVDTELSLREVEVLRLVANGNANKRIALQLEVTVDTVKAHMKAVLAKLDARDRAHAVTLALRRGVIELSD